MMTFTERSYQGIDDISSMCELAGSTLQLRNGCSYWHPGDVVWMLYTHSHMGLFEPQRDIRLWFDTEGHCVAIAWFYMRLHARFDIHPDAHEALIDAVLAWMENHCRAINPDNKTLKLSTTGQETDLGRADALAASGYHLMPGRAEDVLCCNLTALTSLPEPADGMHVHNCMDVDLHARAACHRDAWSNLDHIDRGGQVSQFHDHIYAALRTAPRYNPALDLVVETQAGDYAACCIAWADDKSRVGVFEPVGTRPAWRGLRLSALLNETAMILLKEQGMERALVMSSPDNNPTAWRAYRRVFEPIGRMQYYLKDLN